MKNTLMMKNGNNLLPNYPEGHNLLLIKKLKIRILDKYMPKILLKMAFCSLGKI